MSSVNTEEQNIQVGVRVRPLTDGEIANGECISWDIADTVEDCEQQRTLTPIIANSIRKIPSNFSFRHVFGPDTRTSTIYDRLVRPIVASSFEGYNGAIFAYGQTSAGKTFTMTGTPTHPGIIPLALRHVFAHIRACQEREYLLRISIIEVYNETVIDLLNPSGGLLTLLEDRERGVVVRNISEEIVTSAESVCAVIQRGEENRHTGRTNMNDWSSRSHCIIRLTVESKLSTQHDAERALVSELNFVDLAGSERISRTGATGARFSEGKAINKSLLFLGIVISALSKGDPHVPFRDSKLTRILQNTMGGNSQTAFVCNITPAGSCMETSLSTLRLAMRAIRVRNNAHINEVASEATLLNVHKDAIRELKHQLVSSEQSLADQSVERDCLRKNLRGVELQLQHYKTLYLQLSVAQSKSQSCVNDESAHNESSDTVAVTAAVTAASAVTAAVEGNDVSDNVNQIEYCDKALSYEIEKLTLERDMLEERMNAMNSEYENMLCELKNALQCASQRSAELRELENEVTQREIRNIHLRTHLDLFQADEDTLLRLDSYQLEELIATLNISSSRALREQARRFVLLEVKQTAENTKLKKSLAESEARLLSLEEEKKNADSATLREHARVKELEHLMQQQAAELAQAKDENFNASLLALRDLERANRNTRTLISSSSQILVENEAKFSKSASGTDLSFESANSSTPRRCNLDANTANETPRSVQNHSLASIFQSAATRENC